MSRTIKGDLAIEILKKFPDAPNLQLARMLFKDNPKVFMNVEDARECIRYYTGSIGKTNREMAETKELFRDIETSKKLQQNPFGLPESHSDNWKPMRLPIEDGKGLLLYDEHIPYHDKKSITLALQWGLDNDYDDFILLGGDLLDCYQLSHFQRDPNKRKFVDELKDCNQFLHALRNAYPKAKIIWKHGNHESRLERYFKLKASELFDIGKFIWEKFLDLNEIGVTIVKHDIPLYIGKLNIIHGHELTGSHSIVNPARGAYLRAMECVIEGHFHRTSQHAEMSFSRRLDTSWSVGCLCCLWPEFSRINKWNSGFAALKVKGKDFEIENKRILLGMVR
jgi:hypothetical protein